MAETAKTQQNRLIPSPKELQKALKQSADQARRIATALNGWKPYSKVKANAAEESRLSLTPKELEKALKVSADRAQRLAAAFSLTVPGIKAKAVKH
jgi:hypothetical protein